MKKQGRRPAEFAGQLLFGSSKYLCPAHSDSSGIVTGDDGAQRENSAFSGKSKQKKSKNRAKTLRNVKKSPFSLEIPQTN